jgi:plasmid stabilization system protein ParE
MLKKKFDIYLCPCALEDLNTLIQFYKKLKFRLARNLIIELNQTFAKLYNQPYTLDEQKYKSINLSKLPVTVIYKIESHNIIILAIVHKNQNFPNWIFRV